MVSVVSAVEAAFAFWELQSTRLLFEGERRLVHSIISVSFFKGVPNGTGGSIFSGLIHPSFTACK
jgi:hypothetical protein